MIIILQYFLYSCLIAVMLSNTLICVIIHGNFIKCSVLLHLLVMAKYVAKIVMKMATLMWHLIAMMHIVYR